MASVCQSMRLLSFLKWLPDSPVQGGHFTFQPLLLDENLIRAELSPTELGEHITRRKELWVERSETGGKTLPTSLSDGRGAGPQHQKGFASDTAKKTGMSKRAINLATSRTEAIPGDIRAIIKGTKLDIRLAIPI